MHTPGATTGGNGTAEVFVRGLDNKLHWRLLVNGTWKPWATNAYGVLAAKPAAASWGPGRDDVFVRGASSSSLGALYQRAFVNGVWGPWQGLGGQMLNGPGASSWGPGQLSVFVQGRPPAVGALPQRGDRLDRLDRLRRRAHPRTGRRIGA